MTSVDQQKYFLLLLAHGDDINLQYTILKHMNDRQLTLLKNIANDVLDEIIPLNTKQFKILVHYKDFIRKLGRGTASKRVIQKNLHAIQELAKLVIDDNEIDNQAGIITPGKMGKNKGKISSNFYDRHSGSGTNTPQEEYSNDIIWEEYVKRKNEEEQSEEEEETDDEDET